MISYASKWTSYPDKPAHSAACSFFLLLPVDSFWSHLRRQRHLKLLWQLQQQAITYLGIKSHHLIGVVLERWEKSLLLGVAPRRVCEMAASPTAAPGDVPGIHSRRVLGPAPCLCTPAHLGAVTRTAVVHAQTSIPACAGLCFRHRHEPAHVGELLLGQAVLSRSCYHRRWWNGRHEGYWVNLSLQIQP